MTQQIAYLNGSYLPLSEARIPVLDRGFLFGDGIYEVVPVYHGKPFRLAQHLQRLARSLSLVRIDSPMTPAGWNELIETLVQRHPQWPNQLIYLQITRGVAPRDHAFPAHATPTVFAMSNPFTPPTLESIGNGLSAITLPDERWLHCDIKSISLLGNILARQAAVEADTAEALLFRDGFLTEGSSSNIWVVKDGELLAPPTHDHLILEGIRYALLQELAQHHGIPFTCRRIHRDEVFAADELLLTAASKEVKPITRLDGRPIGQSVPGPVFRQLFAAYQTVKASS